jgi:hypothetical protein
VNNLGKGHRERRKVAYSEEALASAAYTKAQVTEEREGRLQRLQQTGGSDNGDPDWSSGESPENQDTEFFNSAQPCTDEPHEVMDANDLDREEEDHSCLNDGSSSHDKELSVSTSGGSTPAVLPTTDTAGTSPKTTVTDVGVSLIGRQQEGSTTATAKCIQLIDAMMTTLMRLCQALKLPVNSHKTLSLGFCEFPRILCSLAVCLLGCGFLRSVEIGYIIVLSLFGGHEDQRTSFPPASGAVLFRMYSVSLAAVSQF